MKKLLFSIVCALCIMLTACSSESPEMVTPRGDLTTTKFDLNAALALAEQAMEDLDPATRGMQRSVGSVEVVRSEATRGALSDTLLYLINYSDNTGFALMDAEGKNGAIYAISPEGHLEFSDSIDNPALAYFFNKVKKVSAETPTRGTDDFIVTGPEVGKTEYRTIKVVGPLLTPLHADWKCENVLGVGGQYVPGNVVSAVPAMAKLLAYYQNKPQIGKVSIDWQKVIFNNDFLEVFNMLTALNYDSFLKNDESIDDSKNINESFIKGEPAREVFPLEVENALTRLFGSEPDMKFFDQRVYLDEKTDLKAILNGQKYKMSVGAPIIACGLTESGSGGNKYYQYWVIDGYWDRNIVLKLLQGGFAEIPMNPLFHCVWGKNTYTNGYYAYEVDGDYMNNWQYLRNANDPVTTDTLNRVERKTQSLFEYPCVAGGFNRPIPTQPN